MRHGDLRKSSCALATARSGRRFDRLVHVRDALSWSWSWRTMVKKMSQRARPQRTLKQRAIALLARREYARAELATRLAATGAARDEVAAVIEELVNEGLLSDARFAAALVHRKARDLSRSAIIRALREKGVAADDAKDALAELGEVDELARARALWKRRFGAPPVDEREKARQLRFLVSRGFAHAIALRALKLAGPDDE